MHAVIADNRDEIVAICQRYRVSRLEVFGSAARGTDFDPETSDADFLYEFEPPVLHDINRRYAGMTRDLQALLGRKVDLIRNGLIDNEYLLAAINECREVVYDSKAPDGPEPGSGVADAAPMTTDRRLFAAALANDIATAAELIELGADVNTRNRDGRTPLHLAAGGIPGGHIAASPEMISLLIQAGADPAARDDDGETPLDLACRAGNAPVIKALEAAGSPPASIDPASPGREVVSWLQDQAGIRILTESGTDPDEIRWRIEAGADVNAVNQAGHTPMHWAASRNTNPEMITRLVQLGAELEARDEDGKTPLHHAAGKNDNPEIVTTLLELGADVDARDEDGQTPLHHAAGKNDNPDMTARLARRSGEVNAVDKEGATALHAAARCSRNPEIIDTLVRLGADPNARDKDGRPPLHVAAHRGHCEALARLIEAGADITARDGQRRTALHHAATARWNDESAVITHLLDLGADPTARDENDNTPLHLVDAGCDREAERVISTLLELGADLEARNKDGQTPLELARALGSVKIVKALVAARRAAGQDGQLAGLQARIRELEAENSGLRAEIAVLESQLPGERM